MTISASKSTTIFRISPLIRITLLSFYVSLTLPLPFLAEKTNTSIPSLWLWVGMSIGFMALYAALSERVILDDHGIQVTYPLWIPKCFRDGWSLAWSEIRELKPRTTGQGGLVYYLLGPEEQAYLLPMRVANFNKLVREVQAKTGIDTTDIYPLSQPWMYLILLVFTLLLFLVDAWVLTTAIALQE